MKKKVYSIPVTKTFRLNLEEAFLGVSNEKYNLGNLFDEEFVDDEDLWRTKS